MAIYLGLGSNQGNREDNLRAALEALARRGVDPVRCASLYSTEPRDFEAQPWFLNTVLEVRTTLAPADLLECCLAVERQAGRVRDSFKGPRPIDLDILLYDSRILESPELVIPHPRYRQRRFVLVPLAELAGDTIDPLTHRPIRELLEACEDSGTVQRYAAPLL